MSDPLIEFVGWLWRKWRQHVPRGSQPSEEQIAEFYKSWEWKRARYDTGGRYGWRCMACGDKLNIRIDHIKPLRKYWDLRLDRDNLQVLCNDCNMGKGSRDETDFRPRRLGVFGLFKK